MPSHYNHHRSLLTVYRLLLGYERTRAADHRLLITDPITGVAITLLLACVVCGQTQNSYPMLMSLRPVAVQVGQVTECEVSARYNLFGATSVFVSGVGVTGEVVPPEKKEGDKPPDANAAKPNVPKMKLRFTATPDAVPGPRDFRVVMADWPTPMRHQKVLRGCQCESLRPV